MNQTHNGSNVEPGIALCRVTYRMTDQMGVVYYGNYMELFEMGRVEMLRASGVRYRDMEHEGYLLPVMRAECDYMLAARYDELLQIRTKIQRLTRARIHFGYEITRDEDGELIARGATQHAFLSPEGKLRRLSPEWMTQLESLKKD